MLVAVKGDIGLLDLERNPIFFGQRSDCGTSWRCHSCALGVQPLVQGGEVPSGAGAWGGGVSGQGEGGTRGRSGLGGGHNQWRLAWWILEVYTVSPYTKVNLQLPSCLAGAG